MPYSLTVKINKSNSDLKLYSIVIPARDEAESLVKTVTNINNTLLLANIPHEIIVVDDGSTDQTWVVLQKLKQLVPELKPIQNLTYHGFGRAVVCGLDNMSGDACVIMMADESDSPTDAVMYWLTLNEGYDCVFGSRFIQGGGYMITLS